MGLGLWALSVGEISIRDKYTKDEMGRVEVRQAEHDETSLHSETRVYVIRQAYTRGNKQA